MGKLGSFFSGVLSDSVEWSRGRFWWWRLPLLLSFAWILVHHLRDAEYQSLFGGLNLGIHELGHAIFMFLGRFLCTAAGSFTQCLVPVISMLMFYRQRDYFAIAVSFGWLGTNLFGVATYVGDARAQDLPLVSPFGGEPEHDWFYLLNTLGILEYDTTLAFLFQVAAALSMLVCLGWGGFLLWKMVRPGPPQASAQDGPVTRKSILPRRKT
jgi:hypothetical protein